MHARSNHGKSEEPPIGPRITAADVVMRSERDAVLLKPAGLSSEAPSTAGKGPATLLVQARVLLGWPEAQLPHRIDRPTRGFVVVARDSAAVAAHNEAIRAGRWSKHYLARISAVGTGAGGGKSTSASTHADASLNAHTLVGQHNAYLRRDGAVARVVRSGGDPSTLVIEAVAPAPGCPGEWHAVIRLVTGRFHQIRAMLGALGFPLVGDQEYGGAPGQMYLDHASLWFPSIIDGSMQRAWLPVDPRREAIDPVLISALANARAVDGQG